MGNAVGRAAKPLIDLTLGQDAEGLDWPADGEVAKVGDTFGDLTLIERLGKGICMFRCVCGRERPLRLKNVRKQGLKTVCKDR